MQSRVTMTGEVTLRGRVLPIGGLKEKLLAATRSGFTKVIIPKENEPDFKEIAHEIDPGLKIVFVENMDQVLVETLARSPFIAAKKSAKKAEVKLVETKIVKKNNKNVSQKSSVLIKKKTK